MPLNVEPGTLILEKSKQFFRTLPLCSLINGSGNLLGQKLGYHSELPPINILPEKHISSVSSRNGNKFRRALLLTS